MAIFIDKYNCQVALADRGRMWLRAFEDQKRLSVEDCWRGLLFTYAMDYGKEFSTLSGVLMEFGPWGSGYCESFHSWKYALDNMAFLPFDVLDHLGMQRDGTKRKIHAALMDAVVKLTTRRSTIPWDDTMNNRSSCNRLAMAIATYTHTLLKLGILPGVPNEGTHTHMSPGQLIQMIEETEFPESPFKERESAVDGLGYGRPSAHVQGTKTLI
ncbi:uncharacterized protein BDV14DRAFT_201877 [Aspergillus stella-maris]|uniref:uncharacterized protein n=1 Tax=Aspergillus stella-maris TaxID=1810926 RepID=UPI003CCCF0A4